MAIKPGEIAPNWLAIAIRLQRMAKTQHVEKCKLLRMTILIDADGNPIAWPTPECTPLEPGDGLKDLLCQL